MPTQVQAPLQCGRLDAVEDLFWLRESVRMYWWNHLGSDLLALRGEMLWKTCPASEGSEHACPMWWNHLGSEIDAE